jgi:hypothetical protein
MPRWTPERLLNDPFFCMLMAPPMNGKTTLLAHLVNHDAPNGQPYKLFFVNLDDQMHPFKHLVHADRLSNVWEIKPRGGMKMDPVTGVAYPADIDKWLSDLNTLVTRWVDPETGEKAPPYSEWDQSCVLVFDSMRAINDAMVAKATKEQPMYSSAHGSGKTGLGRYIQLKDYTAVQAKIVGFVSAFRYMGAKFPVIFTAHTSHRSFNIAQRLSSKELHEALNNADKRKEILDQSKNIVQIDDPIASVKTIGKQLAETLLGYFPYVLAARKEGNKVTLQTKDEDQYILRANDPKGKLATYLPAETALKTILQHHYT